MIETIGMITSFILGSIIILLTGLFIFGFFVHMVRIWFVDFRFWFEDKIDDLKEFWARANGG